MNGCWSCKIRARFFPTRAIGAMVARGSPKAKVAGSSPVLLDSFSFCDFGTKSGEASSF